MEDESSDSDLYLLFRRFSHSCRNLNLLLPTSLDLDKTTTKNQRSQWTLVDPGFDVWRLEKILSFLRWIWPKKRSMISISQMSETFHHLKHPCLLRWFDEFRWCWEALPLPVREDHRTVPFVTGRRVKKTLGSWKNILRMKFKKHGKKIKNKWILVGFKDLFFEKEKIPFYHLSSAPKKNVMGKSFCQNLTFPGCEKNSPPSPFLLVFSFYHNVHITG